MKNLLDRPDNNITLNSYAHFNKVIGRGAADTCSKFGFCTSIDARNHLICINENIPQDEKIFTMAHEIAHLFFGHVSLQFTYPDYERPDYQKAEYDCDLFAAIMMFVINGALPIMEHYSVKTDGGAANA